MAKDRDIKLMIKRVNDTMDTLEKFLNSVKIDSEGSVEVEKDRVSYKEGLVDGLCMMSWVKEVGEVKVDYIGGGEGKVLKDVLEEIGSVYGFDGEVEYKRVKSADIPPSHFAEVKDEVGEGKVTDMEGKDIEVIDEEDGKIK